MLNEPVQISLISDDGPIAIGETITILISPMGYVGDIQNFFLLFSIDKEYAHSLFFRNSNYLP